MKRLSDIDRDGLCIGNTHKGRPNCAMNSSSLHSDNVTWCVKTGKPGPQSKDVSVKGACNPLISLCNLAERAFSRLGVRDFTSNIVDKEIQTKGVDENLDMQRQNTSYK
jgi:hypothetical protein